MGSNIALNSLLKISKKELSIGFDNLVKPEYFDMHSVTNGSVANAGINARFSDETNNDEFLDPLLTIKNLRKTNVNKIVISNLNINSLPNKFNQLKELVLKQVDILVLTETKTILFQIPIFQFMNSLNHLGFTEKYLEVG